MMIEYDYSIPKYQQENALPENALTSVKKGQHVYIAVKSGGVIDVRRYECLTGGSFQPRVLRVKNETGERLEFMQAEKIVIKAGGRDQYGFGNEFFFATAEDCQRHIDRLLNRNEAA